VTARRQRVKPGGSAIIPLVAESLCVYCRERPVDPRFRPFCSERCKLLDLRKWADGDYRVPGEPVEEQRDDDEERER
jgi:endogenous inhibitor of DNA gyrase (YacG/DUF329 family)